MEVEPAETIAGSDPRRGRRGVIAAVLLALLVTGLLAFSGSRKILRMPVDRLASMFHRDSWIEGELPPVRGCILDRNGRPLAWSVRSFALYWRIPERTDVAREELAVLQGYAAGGQISIQTLGDLAGREVLVRDNLSGSEMQALSRLRGDMPGLDIRSRTARRHTASAVLAARVGAVQVVDGAERGISGAEMTHDERLRGRPGHFRVKVDGQGRWIPETWQKTADMRPGHDVFLPVTVTEPALAAAR